MPASCVDQVLPVAVGLGRMAFPIDPKGALMFGYAAAFLFVLYQARQAIATGFAGLEYDCCLLTGKLSAQATSRVHLFPLLRH